MKKLLVILLVFPALLFGQDKVTGVIYEGNSENKKTPLAGANIYWIDASNGAVTDKNGTFSVPYKKEDIKLIISYVGFRTDTLDITGPAAIEHWLMPLNVLDEVLLEQRKRTTSVSYLQSFNIATMNSDELLKAACCNLCESFETNPSIDVNFADAITGTRQIKMLGLTSPYILTAIESVPAVRGASQAYGLSFIPGTWVESIQITKGAGSVVNGFESIAGQINAKLQKPVEDARLFVNAYGAGNGRYELNTHINLKLNDKLFTGFYIHGNTRDEEIDKNDDTFLDMPLAKQINLMNRWQYVDLEKGLVYFFNARYLNDKKQMGQTGFTPEIDKFSNTLWGSEIDTERLDLTGKFSYKNPVITHQFVDILTTYSNHEQDSYFGNKIYNIKHNSLYARAVYSSIISNTLNKFKAGLNFTLDNYNEKQGVYSAVEDFKREETSFGAFFEYNYDDLENFNLTAGLRIDNHNLMGTFLTPRLHVRYTPWEKGAIKASVGRGKRAANIFAENQHIFATARNIIIEDSGGDIYGLDPEIAWNYGLSYLQSFNLFDRKADIALDFYRTNFENQVVADFENPQEVRFYNLEGESYSNSVQFELNAEPIERLNFRFAYKYYDVMTQYKDEELEKPLTPKNRLFANVGYETVADANYGLWKFDVTYNWLGEQRFPSTAMNPTEFRLNEYTPTVATVNTQITKAFSPRFEVYFGGENITNVKQKNPILGASNPFGTHFDTTYVYGPIFGSTYYAGFRFKLI